MKPHVNWEFTATEESIIIEKDSVCGILGEVDHDNGLHNAVNRRV